MNKAMEVKERIIQVTIELIQNSNGNATEITTRDIAEKAKIGNGLINYHFQTKENLISICVERIVRNVVKSFNPDVSNFQSTSERMAYAASQVFEFLFANPAISRISILGDMADPSAESNTVKSQQSICHVLGDSMDAADKQFFSFVMASVMQTAFLASKCGDTMFGYALDTPASRGAFIKKLVDMLMHGVKPMRG